MEVTSEILDEVERKIEEVREKVRQLKDDQKTLHSTLDMVDKELSHDGEDGLTGNLSLVDKEDLKTRIALLSSRLSSVHVEVAIVRNSEQTEALKRIDQAIDQLIFDVQSGCPEAVAKAQSYLDACTKGTGTKFEALLLSCATDDQKSIRLKMEELVEQFKAIEAPTEQFEHQQQQHEQPQLQQHEQPQLQQHEQPQPQLQQHEQPQPQPEQQEEQETQPLQQKTIFQQEQLCNGNVE